MFICEENCANPDEICLILESEVEDDVQDDWRRVGESGGREK